MDASIPDGDRSRDDRWGSENRSGDGGGRRANGDDGRARSGDGGRSTERGATRRRLLSAAVGAAAATAGCLDSLGGGSAGTTTTVTDEFDFETGAFADGGTVPVRHTCDGEDVSPPLSVGGLPDDAETLAVVVDDPDAPGGTYTHWLLWNVPADRTSIPEGIPRTETVSGLGDARQGTNDSGSIGYAGPCPPPDDGPHTYRFTAYAADSTLDLDPGATKGDLTDALSGATLATSRFTGEYGRG